MSLSFIITFISFILDISIFHTFLLHSSFLFFIFLICFFSCFLLIHGYILSSLSYGFRFFFFISSSFLFFVFYFYHASYLLFIYFPFAPLTFLLFILCFFLFCPFYSDIFHGNVFWDAYCSFIRTHFKATQMITRLLGLINSGG